MSSNSWLHLKTSSTVKGDLSAQGNQIRTLRWSVFRRRCKVKCCSQHRLLKTPRLACAEAVKGPKFLNNSLETPMIRPWLTFSAFQHHFCKWSPNSNEGPTDNPLKSYSWLLLIAQQLFGVFSIYTRQAIQFTPFITKRAHLSDSLFLFALQHTNMSDNYQSQSLRKKMFPEVTHSNVAYVIFQYSQNVYLLLLRLVTKIRIKCRSY